MTALPPCWLCAGPTEARWVHVEGAGCARSLAFCPRCEVARSVECPPKEAA